MPDRPEGKKIVVGFDGSAGARAALDWAVDEAEMRHAPLEVVRAWTPGEFGSDEELGEYTQNHLEKELADILSGRSVEWTASAPRGSAGKVLLEEANGSQMLVVGSRGHGKVAGMLLGSVSTHVVTHSGAAAVVIVKDAS
jgi:nucleotide-binding universal stress UspA family protein